MRIRPRAGNARAQLCVMTTVPRGLAVTAMKTQHPLCQPPDMKTHSWGIAEGHVVLFLGLRPGFIHCKDIQSHLPRSPSSRPSLHLTRQ